MKRKMKRLAALLLALCLLAAVPLNAGAVYTYYLDNPGDVPPPAYRNSGTYDYDYVPAAVRAIGESKWYSEAVYDLWFLARGFDEGGGNILSGTGEIAYIPAADAYMRLFRPDRAVTREQVTVMLCRLAKYAGKDVSSTTDWAPRPEDHVSNYAVGAMNWALGHGMIADDSMSLRGKDSITRQELAAILHRFADYIELEPSVTWAMPVFTDQGDFGAWAKDDLIWAYQKGILKGTYNMTEPCGETYVAMSPRSTVTRAMAAQVIWSYAKETGILTYSPWKTLLSYENERLS